MESCALWRVVLSVAEVKLTECDAAPARLPLAHVRRLTECGAAVSLTHAQRYTDLKQHLPLAPHPLSPTLLG